MDCDDCKLIKYCARPPKDGFNCPDYESSQPESMEGDRRDD